MSTGIPANGAWGFQFEISYRFGTDNFYNWDTIKKFIFSYEYGFKGRYNAKKAFWPHGIVTCLGLTIGFGFIKTWA